MGLEQVRGNTSAASPVDYDRYRLRRFVEALDAGRTGAPRWHEQAVGGRRRARSQSEGRAV